jgi:urease accessory protein
MPAGGHVHSGGIEALVDRRLLHDTGDLLRFLDGRVRTAGLVAGAFAAVASAVSAAAAPVGSLASDTAGSDGSAVSAAAAPNGSAASDTAGSDATDTATAGPRIDWTPWDRALDVRTPSPALRAASRDQGTALLRTATRAWPAARGLTALAALGRPHHPLVLGAATAAVGAGPAEAAALAVHHLVGGAATAAVRLLGLDPLTVAAVQASLAPLADRVAAQAAADAVRAVAAADPDLLPADAAPLPEVLAELHHATEVTLFAS